MECCGKNKMLIVRFYYKCLNALYLEPTDFLCVFCYSKYLRVIKGHAMTIGPFIRDKISRDVNRTATYIRREFDYLYEAASFILDACYCRRRHTFVPFIRQARVLCK